MGNASDFTIDDNGELLKYLGTDTTVTVPDGVEVIGSEAFHNQYIIQSGRTVILPDSVKKIRSDAFFWSGVVHIEMSLRCPDWERSGEARVYGFARSLLHRSGSSIAFRDGDGKKAAYVILSTDNETEPKRNGAILSIRSVGGHFDFAGYDAYFPQLAKIQNKLKIALARLECPYELSDEWRGVYETYIKRKGEDTGKLLIDEDRSGLFDQLAEKGLFTAKAAAALLDYAAQKGKAEFTAILLNYTQTASQKGGTKAKKKADPFALEEIKSLEEIKKPEKTIAEWRKEFSFKYKDGGVFIKNYLMDAQTVKIPERIGDKNVIGICEGAFDFSSGKLRKILIPGTIFTIETGTFEFYGDYQYINMNPVTVEIAEGIRSLPENAFGYLQNFTLRLPSSLTEIKEQFTYADKKTIRLIVPENSPAEEFCKRYNLQYTTVAPPAESIVEEAQKARAQIETSIKKTAAKKAVSPWKKPKLGTHLVGRYQGQEQNVVFPTEVEGVYIDGIADTAGDAPENYKAIASVVLPDGYTYIGKKAFAGCKKLETVSLPSTLQEIGGGAFGDCKKLKELVFHKNIVFSGGGTFSGAKIDLLIMETDQKTRIPRRLFFGCKIKTLVVVGGPFKSNSNVFDFESYSYQYSGNFPESIYMNGDFSTLDLKNDGGNAKKIHPLADFDESSVRDEDARSLIAAEKERHAVKKDHKVKPSWQTPTGFSFPGKPMPVSAAVPGTPSGTAWMKDKIFVLTGFSDASETTYSQTIIAAGGTVKSSTVLATDYVVYNPDYGHETTKLKRAKELIARGKPITILTEEEFLKKQ